VSACARPRGSITNFETSYFHRTCFERYFGVLKCGMSMEKGLNTTNTKVMILCTVNNMIPVENVPSLYFGLITATNELLDTCTGK
jgi:hypothetical protein